ncbi:MAG: TOMM precursor leader peptide-binding protein [Nitrospirae bacterium]|nr:TOMM precursor leader peptide-binding protein [Nitrospirota bacterium]
MDPSIQKLKVLPTQLISIEKGVLIKRGCTVLKIQGEGADWAVQTVFSALIKKPSTYDEISQVFPSHDQEAVTHFLDMLIAKRFVVYDSENPTQDSPTNAESPLDIFYWNFGLTNRDVSEKLNSSPITILGVNFVSLRLFTSLAHSGMRNIELVDHPAFRNLRLFDQRENLLPDNLPNPINCTPRNYKDWIDGTDPESIGCLVATSDFGGHSSILEWNRYCLDHHLHFFSVTLRDEIGFVGPLVIPGETACFQCFITREQSQSSNRLHSQTLDEQAFSGQGIVGYHPSMASVLGDIAAIELHKFFGGRLPGWKAGTVIEVNLLTSQMIPRKVLKVPRCPVCSPLTSQSSMSIHKDHFNSAGRKKS